MEESQSNHLKESWEYPPVRHSLDRFADFIIVTKAGVIKYCYILKARIARTQGNVL
jgi:hypothetical protein